MKKNNSHIYNYDTALSIKTRLFIGITLVLLIGFTSINILNYRFATTTLKQSIINEVLPGISNEIYHKIKTSLNASIQISSLMASDTFLKDWAIEGEKDVNKIKKYLFQIKDKYKFFSSFMVSEKSKNYYHFNGLHKIISPDDAHDSWYYKFKKSGKDYALDVDTDQAADGTLTIFINHRLNDYNGNFIGATGVGVKITNIGKFLKSFEDNYKKQVYLVDKNGTIQVHSDQRKIETINIKDRKGIGAIADEILVENLDSITKEFHGENGSSILISKYIPEFNWFLVVEHDAHESQNLINITIIQNILIGISVTMLIIVINFFMVNYYQNKLEKYASTDELTGLSNRRFFNLQAKRDLSQFKRSKTPFSILLLDIDHFKKINDKYGHQCGDNVLQELSRKILQGIRSCDLVARIGGEEFAVLLPNTDEKGAMEAASRIKRFADMTTVPVGNKDSLSLTISLGGISITEPGDFNIEELLDMADKALYASKNRGRNRISFYDINKLSSAEIKCNC